MPSLPVLMSQNSALPSCFAAATFTTMPARFGSGVVVTLSGSRISGATCDIAVVLKPNTTLAVSIKRFVRFTS